MASSSSRRRLGVFLGALVLCVIIVIVYFTVFQHGSPPPSGDDSSTDGTPVVRVEEGLLRGQWIEAHRGRGFKYAAFRGIPYAQPPVGELRFKSPRPAEKWTGVRNATTEGSPCVQGPAAGSGPLLGSEDCLFLNVFSPRLPSHSKSDEGLPVYFYIHGGKFLFGSSSASEFGPDFLVMQDIVVVTFNYRLNIFGFFALDTEEVPGNAGLKDQVAALRWVHRNIAAFGGDPGKVTVGGNSAGSASASLLSLLPATEGLLRAAICVSGSAVHSWSTISDNIAVAQAVAKELGAGDVADLSAIASVAVGASAADLFEASTNVTNAWRLHKDVLGNDIRVPYSPTLELRSDLGSEYRLITKDPESYVIARERSDVPIMQGEANREWSILLFVFYDFTGDDAKLEEEMQHLAQFVPRSIFPGANTRQLLGIADSDSEWDKNATVSELRDYFITGSRPANGTELLCRFGLMMDESFIMADTTHFLRLRARYSSEATYAFLFSTDSEYNRDIAARPQCFQGAAAHGDDTRHVWRSDVLDQDYYGSGTASRVVRQMVQMEANFVKYGNPTPKVEGDITTVWKPIQNGDGYLEIGNEGLTHHDGPMGRNSSAIWINLFSKYRQGKSP